MATETLQQQDRLPEISKALETAPKSLQFVLRRLLLPLASLKFTVVLFALAIFIVLAGTFAQVDHDIWVVINDYFRIQPGELFQSAFPWVNLNAAFVRIDFQLFFPPSFFPGKPEIPGWFYFPKGWLIGGLMAINLVAAHAFRFRIQAKGIRLWSGLAVIALGCVITWMVIASGSNEDGLQAVASVSWTFLWNMFVSGLVLIWGLGLFWIFLTDRNQRLLRNGLIVFELILGGLVGWLMYQGDAAQLGDSSMRILWQLIKATFAAIVLLAGCWMVFKKRSGIVLLHGGIGLMMFSELLVGTSAVEGQMVIQEGETVSFSRDIRTFELAVIDPASDPEREIHTVVPKSVFLNAFKKKEKIQHGELPFDLKIISFLKNSRVSRLEAEETSPADSGAGLRYIAREFRATTGTDMGGAVDIPSAYVELTRKGTDDPLGTYLFSLDLNPQPVNVGGKTYDVALRFKRMYKPYSMKLFDVRKEDYVGTSTPKDYSSFVRLVDEERNVDRKIRIWMNNPLRFGGETFYQSSYAGPPDVPVETTTLQVVTNTGWMIPYVSCMIVAVGMFAQFGITLLRFLNRQSAQELKESDFVSRRKSFGDHSSSNGTDIDEVRPASSDIAGRLVPLLIVLVFAGWLAGKTRVPQPAKEDFNLVGFGKLPVIYQGRVKPMDTLARNSLRVVSGRQTFPEGKKDYLFFFKKNIKRPAIVWLMDVIARPDEARKHRVFEIRNPEVLQTLGLERRKTPLYSMEELEPQLEEFDKQTRQAIEQPKEDRSVYQKKILALRERLGHYRLLVESFQPPRDMPEAPTLEEFNQDRETARRNLSRFIRFVQLHEDYVEKLEPPRVVPVRHTQEEKESDETLPDVSWEPYSTAWTRAYSQTQLMNDVPDATFSSLNTLIVAYAKNDPKTFNQELKEYQKSLKSGFPDEINTAKINFETFFNHFEPFYHASVLYVLSFILASLSWLGWTRVFSRSSLCLILFTFALHTLALIARIYISGRPPVTNLYSSAIFIGWGCVLLGMIIEAVFRKGIGNVVSSISGFATLLIAHLLTTAVPSFRGDTFTVMLAVLDTQFWLATHVVAITLGYATTFLAGLLGIIYIVRGLCTPSLTSAEGRELIRMIYGTLCFAIFFSFVGTVLGGLWADDSWGRFWGWDPKENGALIIVLWNALVLHARWGGMVKDRGLAVLAVFGNIVTSWSWFGVNELGVGLHSYGFTEGVMLALLAFFISQMIIITAGSLPKSLWWSFRERDAGDQSL